VEIAMFEEEERPKRAPRFMPLPLDGLGVQELREYIASLQAEISRAEAAIAARGQQRNAADAVFGKSQAISNEYAISRPRLSRDGRY
jgi:uncharacterized small protein (DUF1192 family)